MAVRTDFSMVSLPALERNLVDRLAARCRILSTTDVNKSLFRLPKCSGRPRYFPDPPSLAMFRHSLASVFVSVGVFDEKVIDDFSLLIF